MQFIDDSFLSWWEGTIVLNKEYGFPLARKRVNFFIKDRR